MLKEYNYSTIKSYFISHNIKYNMNFSQMKCIALLQVNQCLECCQDYA